MNTVLEPPICPECGTPLAQGVTEGLCGRCLIVQGLRFSATPPAEGEPPRSFGDYDLLEEIARGGMGIIYRARQRSLDRIVAVKTLLFGPQAGAEQVKRFRAEASAAASLQHPNIVAIHEVGVHQGEHYLVMDFVDGPNLARFIKERPLPPRRAAAYLKSISEAVQFAHETGILHRDLKPSNILIDSHDEPRITDFGLARRLDTDSSLTLSGHFLGSPSYMPPEQAGAGCQKVSRASDVYSLGAMFYHMLIGRPPFVSESLNQTLDQVFNAEPIAPRLLNPSIPRDLETLCLKCLEKEPARRYPTAQGLADELGRFLRNEPILSRPVSAPERVWRWSLRRPALAFLTFLTAFVASLAVAGISWEWRRAEERRITSEQNLYVANIHLANEAVEHQYAARAQLLLDAIASSPVQQRMRGWEWRYVAGRIAGNSNTLLDQGPDALWSVAVSADGDYVATLGEAGYVRLYQFPQRRFISSWYAHRSAAEGDAGESPYALAFTPDSRTLITSGYDRFVRLWDIPSGSPIAERSSPGGRLALSRDGSLLASSGEFEGKISLWQVSADPVRLSTFNSRLSVLAEIAFAPDAQILFLAGPAGQLVRRYDVRDPTKPVRLADLDDSDSPLAISPDGKWLASARANCQPFRICSLPSLKPVTTGSIAGSYLASLKFSPDNSTLAMGLQDGRIELWPMNGASEPVTLLGHSGYIMQLDFSADGRTLISASQDKTVRLWDMNLPDRQSWSFRTDHTVHDVCFSPDSKRLASISQITKAGTNEPERLAVTQLWDVDDRHGLFPQKTLTNAVKDLGYHLRFSPNGALLAIAEYDTFHLVQIPSLEPVAQFHGRFAGWPSNGDRFAYNDGTAVLRGSSSDDIPTRFPAAANPTAVALSPDGHLFAECGKATQWAIQLRDTATGTTRGHPFEGHESWVSWLAFSPDGRILVSTGWNEGWIGFWDVLRQRRLAFIRGHNGSVNKAVFSPDGKTLATCGSDELIRLWSVALLQEVAVLSGHSGSVNGVAFSPDGRWLASASIDGTIRLWSAPSFEQFAKSR